MLGEKTSSVLGKLSHGFRPWRDTLVRLFAERLLPPSCPRPLFIFFLFSCFLASGCTVTRYEGFSRYTLGTKVSIPDLQVEVSTNGTKKIRLKGYSNDGVEALGVIAEGLAKGAISGVKGQ